MLFGYRCLSGGLSFSSHHQTVTGRLGMGLPHSSFFSQLASPWDWESFSFLREPDVSCPEPKFAVTALVLVGFHLGGLGRVLRLAPVAGGTGSELRGVVHSFHTQIIYYRT